LLLKTIYIDELTHQSREKGAEKKYSLIPSKAIVMHRKLKVYKNLLIRGSGE